ncbi:MULTISPECIES: phospholipase D-like domain-containing protein [unclassified Rhizobium]|uniref:phospholipase D-like domain-containing protein n=1 Tax=unclassified Rhizobium TaxID=2613769 RepID=UPI003818ED7A
MAHNKIMVIDEWLAIGGSYNCTASAQKRDVENVTFLESRQLAREHWANWISV